jgi:hypothetical protein
MDDGQSPEWIIPISCTTIKILHDCQVVSRQFPKIQKTVLLDRDVSDITKFEVFTVNTPKIPVVRDMTSCILLYSYQRFGGPFHILLQGIYTIVANTDSLYCATFSVFIICTRSSHTSGVSKPWSGRLYYAARSHICKLCTIKTAQ